MGAFTPFPKIPRLFRDCIITEKIDGTNAQILILPNAEVRNDAELMKTPCVECEFAPLVLFAGSRTKFISPGKQTDNAGFANWVWTHAPELFGLGVGQHFGEWYGSKIQRGYGLDHKRFALFNVSKWATKDRTGGPLLPGQAEAPGCCEVVPTLYRGPFDTLHVVNAIRRLQDLGSVAVPGYMDPEGIIVYHEAAQHGFKVTCKNDEKPKGQTNG